MNKRKWVLEGSGNLKSPSHGWFFFIFHLRDPPGLASVMECHGDIDSLCLEEPDNGSCGMDGQRISEERAGGLNQFCASIAQVSVSSYPGTISNQLNRTFLPHRWLASLGMVDVCQPTSLESWTEAWDTEASGWSLYYAHERQTPELEKTCEFEPSQFFLTQQKLVERGNYRWNTWNKKTLKSSDVLLEEESEKRTKTMK